MLCFRYIIIIVCIMPGKLIIEHTNIILRFDYYFKPFDLITYQCNFI